VQLLERTFPRVGTSNVLKEIIVSVTTLGSAVGGFAGGFASDYFGRCGSNALPRSAAAVTAAVAAAASGLLVQH
jgi:MFS family permease